jgi:hypothetical protein
MIIEVVKKVHKMDIKSGDTIIHFGEKMTVCKSNIKEKTFMGRTIFGDSYKLGHQLVEKIIFAKLERNA